MVGEDGRLRPEEICRVPSGGNELDEAMKTATQRLRGLGHAVMKGLPYDMDKDMPGIRATIAAVRIAARRELGLERPEIGLHADNKKNA